MQDPSDALQDGRRILAQRRRRARLAQGALLGLGVGAAVVTGAALGSGIAAALAMVPVLCAPMIKSLLRRRVARPDPPAITMPAEGGLARLGERLRLRVDADRIEGSSVTWPMVAAGAIAPILYGGLLAAVVGLSLGGVGKGLLAIAHLIGIASLTLGLGMHGEARRLLSPGKGWWGRANPGRPALLAAGVITGLLLARPLSSDLSIEVALAGGLFVLGSGAGTITPALWWMRRQLRKERKIMGRIALPAATENGPEVRAWLEAATVAPEAPAAMRAEALVELVQRFKITETRATLEAALGDRAAPMVTTAIALCLEHRHRPSLERLLELAELSLHSADSQSPEARVEAKAAVDLCRLIRRYQDPRIEPLFVRMLGEPVVEVASAAAESLGLVGSIDGVEPLRKAAARAQVRAMATEAIERIQIRHHRGQGGALSLADGAEVGEVSLVEGGEGALSLPTERPRST